MKGRLRSGTRALGMSKVIGRSRLPCPPTRTTARIAAQSLHQKWLADQYEEGDLYERSREPRRGDQRGERDDEQAEHGGENGQDVNGEPDGAVPLRPHRLRGRRLMDHVPDDAEVVRNGENSVDDERADNDVDQDRTGLGSGDDDPEFPEEPCERGYADERGHEQGHAHRDARGRPDEPVEVLGVLPDEVDDEERAHVHDRVGSRVDQYGLHGERYPGPLKRRESG